MSKILECGRLVPGCDYVVHGDTEDEVMVKMAEHAHSAHEIDHLSEDLKARIRSVIREDQEV